MEDPYAVLGVARDAGQDEIRAAYRKLAKQHHPDLNPGSKAAEERFKAVSVANELLSEPERRASYDRGEIDASGQERPQPRTYRSYAEGEPGDRYGPAEGRADRWDADDLGGIFGRTFGAGAARAGLRMRGRDEMYGLAIEFLEAVNGATRRLTLPDGRTLDVRVPVGTQDGQTLRLRGQGGAGLNGGPPGDALIELHVLPHLIFGREGRNLRLDLPVNLAEAVLGAKVAVPTPSGEVMMTVAPGSDTGRELRLRGKGVPAHDGQEAGDLHVTLHVVIGQTDPALEAFLRSWKPGHSIDPRRDMGEAT